MIFYQFDTGFSLKNLTNMSQESTALCSTHGFPETFNLLDCIMGVSDPLQNPVQKAFNR